MLESDQVHIDYSDQYSLFLHARDFFFAWYVLRCRVKRTKQGVDEERQVRSCYMQTQRRWISRLFCTHRWRCWKWGLSVVMPTCQQQK